MEMLVLLLLVVGFTPPRAVGQGNTNVGRGIADMTGLVSEGALYGYANPFQDARGLHLRQYSRAFVFENGGQRAAVVVTDTWGISGGLHKDVMEGLERLYGDLYTAENVMLCPQHSHSTPGGFNTYWMYQLVSLGFINETNNAYRDAIILSIQRAHDDLQPGSVYMNWGDLLDGNINRSPYAYDNNPQEERDRYAYNVDKEMTVLKLVGAANEDLGMASFYAVHTTSLKRSNRLVSPDNKGAAATFYEQEMNPGLFPPQYEFVAAFAQGSQGDASPNVNDARCDGTDELCFYNTSTCPDNPEDSSQCSGRGPDGDMFEDTRIIGERQYLKARELYDSASQLLGGVVDYRFIWVNMSQVVADVEGQMEELCRPAMGYSFAAGATDGPGAYPFYQGMLESIPELDDLVDAVIGLPQWLQDCQEPKPVLIPSGNMDDRPWPWQPSVVPLQIIRIGEFFLVGAPGEITTMAGRRVAEVVKNTLIANGLPSSIRVQVTAMANEYSSYIVTSQEYAVQRYEAASTIFGPYTLDGYLVKYGELADALGKGETIDIGDEPPDLRGYPDDALDPVLTDATDIGQSHGDIIADVDDTYLTGETAFATFAAGNPRNNLMTDKTFLEVQQQNTDSSWSVAYTDANWETKFIWLSNCQRPPPLCLFPNFTGCTPINITEFKCWEEQFSNATIEWDIPANQQPGTYRLLHYGYARLANETVVSYSGASSSFEVLTADRDVVRRHSSEYYAATTADPSEEGPDNFLQFLYLYLGQGSLLAELMAGRGEW